MATVRVWTGIETRALRQARRMSVPEFAEHLGVGQRSVAKWEAGGTSIRPLAVNQAALDTSLASADADTQSRFAQLLEVPLGDLPDSDDVEALELQRRVNASDVGEQTLDWLEAAFDDAAMRYANTPPAVLLTDLRQYLRYTIRLVEAKATLRQRHRLLAAAGWLSLLAATLHVDLQNARAAAARLTTAMSLARSISHPDLEAWCWETSAWNNLTDGALDAALDQAEHAIAIASPGGSAHIQATAQAGRARARMGQRLATATTLLDVEHLTSNLTSPSTPEHHYHYDPGKTLSYTATTLAWAGDPAAADVARYVLDGLVAVDPPRPRRIAAAQVDLALALGTTGELDEAASLTRLAIASGRVVPSNYWRVREVAQTLASQGYPDCGSLCFATCE